MKLVLSALIYTTFFIASLAAVDETLEEKTFGADVADASVRRITRTGIFKDDRSLLRRIGFTETAFGEDPKTYRDGYFGGIWQVDEEYFNLSKQLSNNSFYTEIRNRWGINWQAVTWTDLLKPFYSALASRLYLQHLESEQGFVIPGTIDAQAAYWVAMYRRNGTIQQYTSAIRRLESDPVCEGMMDVAVVLDGSGSIGIADFVKAKNFVADLVRTFSQDKTRVSFIIYGDAAIGVFDFQHSFTNEEMDFVVRNATYPSQNTNTPAGLLKAVEFYSAITKRNGAPQLVLTLTDGLHNRGNLPSAISAVKNASLTSFAVGIGSEPEYLELLQIASLSPKRVFMLENFDALAEFIYQMNSATCEVPQHPGLGSNQTGSLNADERRYFQYPIPEGDSVGINFNLDSLGEIEGWYSFTEAAPNSAVHDGTISKGTNYIPIQRGGNRILQEEPEPEVPSIYITLQASESLEYLIRGEEEFQEPSTTEAQTTNAQTTEAQTTEVQTTNAQTTSDQTTEAKTDAPGSSNSLPNNLQTIFFFVLYLRLII